MLRDTFTDSGWWLELADKHLANYTIPDWHETCSRERMIWWLERLDMTEKDYVRLTNTTLDEFRRLNPDWPLRAFVGLILELYDERETGNTFNRSPSKGG